MCVSQKLVEWVKFHLLIIFSHYFQCTQYFLIEVPLCKIVTRTTNTVCSISWLMLKLHELKPLVKVNRVRICIENFNIFVAENLVEWLIFQLKLKFSEVVSKNSNLCLAMSLLMLKLHELSNTVCSISWLMLKLHELRPLVKVNRVRI